MSRALVTAAVLVATAAHAQVVSLGSCGPGKTCAVKGLSVAGPTTATDGGTIVATVDGGVLVREVVAPYMASEHAGACYNLGGGGAIGLTGNATTWDIGVWWSDKVCRGAAAENFVTVNAGGDGALLASRYIRAADWAGGITGLGTGTAGNGTAFASFAACAGATEGRLRYDSTNTVWRWCDGSTWQKLATRGADSWTAIGFGTWSDEALDFAGAFYARAATDVAKVTCSWGTAGSGGTTGVVAQIYDKTGAAEVCSCTLGACNTAAYTPKTCSCTGALTAGSTYTVRLKNTTDCAGNPSNVVCVVN